ncbi:DUF3450 domain-containing protein [Marinobacterium arenosum]|uniref:DUF3450 domain-containing protein n=1 Tax=Marinobacterium arenosum TaxID=2862496 RepID=UPI001C950EC5|nr:DUF3450 domain-containing protein [Marinobacterium arenosum]MBY4678245.1 DUF3450 domain-containing protein [Marinobacterium arenosum]
MNTKGLMRWASLPGAMLAALLFSTPSLAADPLQQATAAVVKGHQQDKRSQQKIDQLDDQARAAYAEYRAVERQAELVEAYNRQLQKLVSAQQAEIDDLSQQIISLEQTEQAVLPMLARMVEMLDRFVAADTPFLPDERRQRIARLNNLLARADISLAEKYRQILEAYLIEVDYGRTLEAYRGELVDNGTNRQVNFLRLGRAALYYQTLDGRQSALWQPAEKRWQPLADSHNPTLDKAIRIAWQQAVPELLDLPLPTPEVN